MLHNLFFFPPILHEHTSAGLDGWSKGMTRENGVLKKSDHRHHFRLLFEYFRDM